MFIESDAIDEDEFEPCTKRRSQTAGEDEDFQLALELSKESPVRSKRKSTSRSSFIFAEDHAKDDDANDEEEDVFDEKVSDSDKAESDDDAFSEEEIEEEKPKKGKKATKPAAKIVKPTKITKPKMNGRTKETKDIKETKAITAPRKETVRTAPVKRPSLDGVKILQQGPIRRVGLSKVHAPKGPLSPVKIKK